MPELSDPNARTAGRADELDARTAIPQVLRRSGSQAGGPANDLNPSGRDEGPAPPRGDLATVLQGKDLFHGNYCGAGQRGEGLEPTDVLDAACQRHDACYDAAGHPSCACNRTLKREAALVSDQPDVPLEIRRRALSVAEAADAMRCERP
ncbi:phospholipase A2 family protein [Methylobacterium sp. ID0610]|uniref:phospholipase A2 family protein n=1 Tax=Methylobacterium carpenticola TaxID=3344827 RepID=UPI0036B1AF3E